MAANAGSGGGAATTDDAEPGAASPGSMEDTSKDGPCRRCCYSVLDALAIIMQWLFACFKCIASCFRNSVYPVKEMCFDTIDKFENCIHPYTKREPVGYLPIFRYDSVASKVKGEVKGGYASFSY
mmetsp:Transcript_61332/g.142713  ORF Transcript_61332/g.142713 Transcript_61332/m.142713 type:complete len:125 (-) Transcript_61332:80-454(-)|eukprot:CAMPEP_0171093412 /NCGR_PEP_ID=MMETSP0766_2-20121228/39069_1 /TAXON_ID=439317 /ORGANISM="Gambierdiscus australes, Strain CAWD 149" /LENGTH=124 /DNA_ID=CAMNT_0011551859 /DNA_START=88 /DNA_END=462 /DNA_ORIENTATION=+